MVDAAKNNPSIFALLLASAKQDFAACQLLAENAGIGDAIVGFHAQQCIEKSLKAVLSCHLIEFRRTHDLIALLDLLHDNKLSEPPQADWLDELTPYAVEARYGTIDLGGLDKGRALEAAKQVLFWALQQTGGTGQAVP